jgi:hypothetical protein
MQSSLARDAVFVSPILIAWVTQAAEETGAMPARVRDRRIAERIFFMMAPMHN